MALRDAILELDRMHSVTGRFGVARVSAVFSSTRVGALFAAFSCGLTSPPSPLAARARALGFHWRLAPGEGGPLTSRVLGLGRGTTSVKRRRIGGGWQKSARSSEIAVSPCRPWADRTRRYDALIDLPLMPLHGIVASGADAVSPPAAGFNLGPTIRKVINHIVYVRTDIVEIDFSLVVARNAPSTGGVGHSYIGSVIVELEVQDARRRCSYWELFSPCGTQIRFGRD